MELFPSPIPGRLKSLIFEKPPETWLSTRVTRMFGPNIGIPEDPVTGAAHCALATYWPQKLGKTTLSAEQASARRGTLQLSVKGDRVELIGQAVLYLQGKITV